MQTVPKRTVAMVKPLLVCTEGIWDFSAALPIGTRAGMRKGRGF